MARVRLGEDTVLVEARQFIEAMKKMAQIAPTKKGTPYHKAGLVEVSRRHNKLSLIVSDLLWGACVEMPCVCRADQRAVIDLDRTHVSGFGRGATRIGDSLELRFTGELVSMGGVPIERQPYQDPAEWSDAWTREGMTKESRSDAFYSPADEFMDAIDAVFPAVRDSSELLGCLHLRRYGKDSWRMEGTDGHRAVLIKRPGTSVRDLLIPRVVARALQMLAPMMEKDRVLLATFNRDVDAREAGSVYARVGLKGSGTIEVVARNPLYAWKTDGKTAFPDIDQVIPRGEDCWAFSVKPQELLLAARGVYDMRWRGKREEGGGECKTDDAAILTRDDTEPCPRKGAVYLEHPCTGKKWCIAEDSRWVGNGNGDGAEIKPLRVGFNPRYLIDAAKSMGSSEVIEMQTDPRFLEPLMLSDDKGGKVLVMPMRI
jgi:hypothetical protein